jgi:methylated-DNA-[protein]-cysteine S-methyltransferase
LIADSPSGPFLNKDHDMDHIVTPNPAIASYHFTTALGWMELTGDKDRLTAVRFVEEGIHYRNPDVSELFDYAAARIREYLEGHRRILDIPYACSGTEFQREAWAALDKIPYGQTLSYRSLARQLDRPGSERAVGRAVGSNPLLLLIPCHRVIGADGRLCGYAGGLRRKQFLLDLESAHGTPDLFTSVHGHETGGP